MVGSPGHVCTSAPCAASAARAGADPSRPCLDASSRTCRRHVRRSPGSTRHARVSAAAIVVGIINTTRAGAGRAGRETGGSGARGAVRAALYLSRDCGGNADRPETYCACAVECAGERRRIFTRIRRRLS